MNDKHVITELHAEACRLTEQAKAIKHQLAELGNVASDQAHSLGHSLAMIGGEFQALAVKLKQATRNASTTNRKFTPRKITAARAAAAMVRHGAYRVAA